LISMQKFGYQTLTDEPAGSGNKYCLGSDL
jgi:hypothetical protein